MLWTSGLDEFLAHRRSRMAEKLIPDISPRGAVLDIGCGNHAPFLVSTSFDIRVGIDLAVWPDWQGLISEGVLFAATDLGSGTLPFKDDTFHLVTMLAVIEHVPFDRMGSILSEVRRVLSPGGYLVVTTPPPRTDRILPALAALGLASKDSIEEHQTIYTKNKLRELGLAHRFSDIEVGSFELGMNLWLRARA